MVIPIIFPKNLSSRFWAFAWTYRLCGGWIDVFPFMLTTCLRLYIEKSEGSHSNLRTILVALSKGAQKPLGLITPYIAEPSHDGRAQSSLPENNPIAAKTINPTALRYL